MPLGTLLAEQGSRQKEKVDVNRASHITLALLLWPFLLLAQKDVVTFSAPGGFYEESFNLTLHCADSLHIRYTLNGNTPTSSSTLYSDALFLNNKAYSKSNFYTIVNTIPSRFYQPKDVDRAIVIRAAAFDGNERRIGEVETQSYFIRSLGCDFHGLPVVSLVADSVDLFDDERGIFVPGVHYDVKDSTATGNYCQTGYDWEREANFEFYEPDNSGVNQICGLRTHGGASRWYQQKGMKLYARREYSNKRFDHDFFGQHLEKGYKRLVLHPFQCSNWLKTGGQDYLSQRVAAHSDLDIDALGVRQTVVFINGEYWGIYTLEESPDQHYVSLHYNLDKEKINLIKWWRTIKHGDITDSWQLLRWMSNSDLNRPEDSVYAFSKWDMLNVLDYLVFEIYSSNLDWPHNNVMMWQRETGEPFRFIFFDGDGCFSELSSLALEKATNSGRDSRAINFFFGGACFRKMFVNRFRELLTTTFSYDTLKSYLDEYHDLVKDEIGRQSARFKCPLNETQWANDIKKVDAFFRLRNTLFERELADFLKTQYADTLSMDLNH